MSTFHPPADRDRCRAIVLIGGQRGRCREPRYQDSDLCWKCLWEETWIHEVSRVPEPKESDS